MQLCNAVYFQGFQGGFSMVPLGKTAGDPLERRATSAKAFGTLANALPEDMLGDLATLAKLHDLSF